MFDYVKVVGDRVVAGSYNKSGVGVVEVTVAHDILFAIYTTEGRYIGVSKYLHSIRQIKKVYMDESGAKVVVEPI